MKELIKKHETDQKNPKPQVSETHRLKKKKEKWIAIFFGASATFRDVAMALQKDGAVFLNT